MEEEEVKKESNESNKKKRWVSCILSYPFFFSTSELLFLFAIILRFLMLLCLKECKLLTLALTYDMDSLGVEFLMTKCNFILKI